MTTQPVYHQFTVLYFPETDAWQVSDEMSDGVYDSETYERIGLEEFLEHHGTTDIEALEALNKALRNIKLKEGE